MGFNTINFIINTANFVNATAGINNSRGQALNQNLQTQNTFASQFGQGAVNTSASSGAMPAQIGFYVVPNQLSVANQAAISTVQIEQQANYIKDLLNLPRDFQSLIQQIQGEGTNSAALKELSKLLVGDKINLSALSQLLAESSKGAAQKLMMTIMAVSKMGSSNLGQLKELMGMFTAAGVQSEAIQTVKNLLMLYLPWLPLSVRNDLNLDFEIGISNKTGGEEGEEGLETITLMIQTANFGNILAVLEMDSSGEISISISAGENFPEKEVIEEMKKESKKTEIKTSVNVQKKQTQTTSEEKEQDFKIATSDFVSPKLILAAHSLIKIIIDVDSKKIIINEEEEK